MNDRSIIQAPEPDGRGAWMDAYLPDQQLAQYQPRPQFISMASIRGILYRQRWMIAGVILIAATAGLIWTLLTTPMYEARSTVKIAPFGNFVVEGQDVDQGISGNQVYDYLATQIGVIKSRSLAQYVAEERGLGNRYDLLGNDIDESRPPNLTDAQWVEEKTKIAASILSGSVVAEVPESNWIIPIGFRSSNPALAAEMANAYADAFVASDSSDTIADNQYAREYLLEQIELTRTSLQEAEEAANLYARNTGMVVAQTVSSEDGGGTVTLTSSNLAGINQRVAEARAQRIRAEQRWRSVQGLPAAQLPEVQTNPVLQTLVSERTARQAELASLRQRYNDQFPEIVKVRSQLDILERQIERSSADIKAAIRNDYTVARNQEQALEGELSSVTGDTLAEQDTRVQYGVLEREAQVLRDQMQALLTRYNQINSAANVKTGVVTKLDAATIPGAPYAPSLTRNITLALVFGVALAAGLAVLRETLDDRIRSLDDVESKIGLPLIGHTPYIKDGSDITTDETNPFSALMEAYSSIRATIDFTLPRNRAVLHLTSSQAGEGKSTTAVILAELFASLGRKTLLIDADLRRPSVTRLLGIEKPKLGLVEVVLGHAELDEAVIKGVHDNLQILPVGQLAPNPAELIASQALGDFIEKCRDEYSLIIMDSSPVMGLADAPMLSRLADATIFVLEANKVPFAQARAAIRRVQSANGNVAGAILTKYKALEAGQSYGYQYGYYQYGDDKQTD